MKHEEALKLMEVMMKLGYSNECIILTLMNCETGMGVGHSLFDAKNKIRMINE